MKYVCHWSGWRAAYSSPHRPLRHCLFSLFVARFHGLVVAVDFAFSPPSPPIPPHYTTPHHTTPPFSLHITPLVALGTMNLWEGTIGGEESTAHCFSAAVNQFPHRPYSCEEIERIEKKNWTPKFSPTSLRLLWIHLVQATHRAFMTPVSSVVEGWYLRLEDLLIWWVVDSQLSIFSVASCKLKLFLRLVPIPLLVKDAQSIASRQKSFHCKSNAVRDMARKKWVCVWKQAGVHIDTKTAIESVFQGLSNLVLTF